MKENNTIKYKRRQKKMQAVLMLEISLKSFFCFVFWIMNMIAWLAQRF